VGWVCSQFNTFDFNRTYAVEPAQESQSGATQRFGATNLSGKAPLRSALRLQGCKSYLSLCRVAASEDAGHIVENVSSALLIVAEIAHQARLDHVDLLLRVLVNHLTDQGG